MRILELVWQHGRLSNQGIAERFSLSPSPCLRRIRRLEDLGALRGYVALLDPQKVGLGLLAYVSVKLEKRGKTPMEDFKVRVQTWPEVVAYYAMMGDMDSLLRVHVTDLEHFSRFCDGALAQAIERGRCEVQLCAGAHQRHHRVSSDLQVTARKPSKVTMRRYFKVEALQ